MENTPIAQFKQALEKYHSTYKKYFKPKLFHIDYGGCGEFVYLLKQPIESLIEHFNLQDQVKLSYVFLDPDSYDIKSVKQENRKCIQRFNKAYKSNVDSCILKDILGSFDFSHVMIKLKIGSSYWFLDNDDLYQSLDSLYNCEGDISFSSKDFDLLNRLIDVDMWNDVFAFYQDREGALEKIGKPLQIMANNLIKKL